MPIYDYDCRSCGHRFELRQSFTAETETSCLECGAVAKRRFHVPTIIYKGSGFYITDYKRKSVSEPSRTESSSNDSSSGNTSENGASATKKKDPGTSEDSGKGTSQGQTTTGSGQ